MSNEEEEEEEEEVEEEEGIPQAGHKNFVGRSVVELDGESLEGVSLRNCPPHSFLEFLIASTHPSAPLQLIGDKCRCQQVAELVVPQRGQTNILREKEDPVRETVHQAASFIPCGAEPQVPSAVLPAHYWRVLGPTGCARGEARKASSSKEGKRGGG